jgi:RNA 2',3'-cyclic 3'-phosphodiesterase
MHRLFVACVPPPEIRRLLLDGMGGVEGARWQSDDQLHLTIRFIGDVDATIAEQIAGDMSLLRGRAFSTALQGVGYFEKRGKAHTLWAGIAPSEHAAALHHKVDRALMAIGQPPEQRAYRPHITLARLSRPVDALGPFLQANATLRSLPFTLDTLTLFESLPTSDGRRYQPVLEVPLS